MNIAHMNINEALRIFLNHLSGERRLAKNTVEAYRRDLSFFFGFLTWHWGQQPSLGDMAKITTTDFRSYMAKRRSSAKPLSAASLARNLSAMRAFFRYIERRWDIGNDAFALIKGPKLAKRLPKPISVHESNTLLAETAKLDERPWVNARDTAILLLLYGAGLRISEALSLTGFDADLAVVLRITGKGDKSRLVPILPIIRKSVTNYVSLYPGHLEKNAPLFRGIRGGALGPRPVQLKIQHLRAALGLPETTTPHALRHSFATHLLSGGGDLRTIQELLGHASLSSTQVYTDVDAASLMKIHTSAHPRA
ncbi:MAG: tyrosine recombinase XerC [Robiginitomaculum sp.]